MRNARFWRSRAALALGLGALALLATPGSWAAQFANQFVEFELPAQWQCNLEGAEWVCQSVDAAKKRDAIIVLAAKLKGDQDSLDQYSSYLHQPKIYTSVKGQSVKSQPKYTKEIQINDHTWVDSLHLQSEIPDFYTRYLATVKNDIGVLVTYSINKDKYAEYQPEFENLVHTLKVFRKPGGINANSQSSSIFNAVPPNLESSAVFGNVPIAGGNDNAPRRKPKSGGLPFEYILAGIVLLAFIIWRKKKAMG